MIRGPIGTEGLGFAGGCRLHGSLVLDPAWTAGIPGRSAVSQCVAVGTLTSLLPGIRGVGTEAEGCL